MVDLNDKRYLMGEFTSHRSEHTVRRSNSVTAAFYRQLNDICRVKILRVRRKAGPARVLDTLIHGQDRNITRSAKAPMVIDRLQIAQHVRSPVRTRPHPVNKIRSRKADTFL